MTGAVVGLLAAIFSALGPNGAELGAALRPPAVAPWLPVERLAALAAELWLVEHRHADWRMAFFLPPATPVAELGVAVLATDRGPSRLLPGLRLPRLFLYRPFYRREGVLQPVGAMPVDVAEHLFAALLDAWLERAVDDCHGRGLGARLRRRAEATMADVPAAFRGEAYRRALVDFGAGALSVANEIARSDRRRRARGSSDLCRLIDRPGTLFGAWRGVFAGAWPGRWRGPDGERISRGVLTAEDRRWLLREALGVAWNGDPRHDFAAMCGRPPQRSIETGETRRSSGRSSASR